MSDTPDTIPPVFFKATDIPLEGNISLYEVCVAAERAVGGEAVIGAQLIRQLWRIYIRGQEARALIVTKGIELRGCKVNVTKQNPFIINGEESEVTKLFISDVPISFANEEIERSLIKVGVVARSKLTMERIRDPAGKLTAWLSGRRFIWIEIPRCNLPKKLSMGPFTAFLYHKEMKEKTQCFKCRKLGHMAKDCQEYIMEECQTGSSENESLQTPDESSCETDQSDQSHERSEDKTKKRKKNKKKRNKSKKEDSQKDTQRKEETMERPREEERIRGRPKTKTIENIEGQSVLTKFLARERSNSVKRPNPGPLASPKQRPRVEDEHI